MPKPRLLPLAITLVACTVVGIAPGVASLPMTQDDPIVGTWEGSIATGGGSLRVVFHIMRGNDGALSATLDSPDQGATGIPVDTASFAEGKLTLAIAAIQGGYEGTLDETGNRLDGTWSQGGGSVDLDLVRASS